MTTTKKHYHPLNGASRRLIILAVLALTSGCASQLRQLPKEAQVELPNTWQIQTTKDEIHKATADDVQVGWLNNFNDAALNKYVDQALRYNPDLLGSAAQLKAAIEQVSISGSELWPSISAGANKNRSEVSGNTADGAKIKSTTRAASAALDITGNLISGVV